MAACVRLCRLLVTLAEQQADDLLSRVTVICITDSKWPSVTGMSGQSYGLALCGASEVGCSDRVDRSVIYEHECAKR